MNVEAFIGQAPEDQQQLLKRLRSLIESVDGDTESHMIEMMGAPMMTLSVKGECKYGFTFGKQLSFHFWPMYCTPSIRDSFAYEIGVPKSRVRKSCFNISPGDELDEARFKEMIVASAGYTWPFGGETV